MGLGGRVLILTGVLLSQTVSADTETQFKVYGFLNADVIGSSAALSSFGNTNLSAPVAVAPSSTGDFGRARNSFQVAQSRIGSYLAYGHILGRLEIDFIDFTKASPVTQALPRLRIADAEYSFDSNHKITFGQDWDLFSSPAKPFTYNFVGLYFHTGNVGFMRQQIKYLYHSDSDWNLGLAVGLVNKNAGSSDSEIELSGVPTVSVLISKKVSSETEIGITGLGGEVRPGSYSSTPLSTVYGVNSFVSYEVASGFKLHENLYYGQNLASTGTLSLASAATSGDTHEIGASLTMTHPLSEYFAIQGGAGISKVMESGGSSIDSMNSVNILSDWKAELAFTYHPEKAIGIYLQGTYFQTSYIKLADSSTDNVSAAVLQLGCQYIF